MISSLKKPFVVSGIWKNLSRKVFSCPQCAQKLRVPIRPGKVLEIHCKSCHSQFRMDFKVPLIEFFRWQSGKSLKLNLVDFKNRFWNLSFRTKIELCVLSILSILLINLIFNSSFLSTSSSVKSPSLDTSSAIRKI